MIVKTKLEVTVFHRHSFKENSILIDQDKVVKSTTIITREDFPTAWREAHLWISKERIKNRFKKRCTEVFLRDMTDYCSLEIWEISDKTNAA